MKEIFLCFISFWLFSFNNFFGQTWVPLNAPPGYTSILKSDEVGNVFIGNDLQSTFWIKPNGQDSWVTFGEYLEKGTIKNIEINESNIFVHHENWSNSIFKYSKIDYSKEKIEIGYFLSFTLVNDSVLVAATSYFDFDFLVSTDEGKNWDKIEFNLDRSFPTMYSSDKVLYLTCNEGVFDLNNRQVYYSTDCGVTWTFMPQFKDYIYSFDVDSQHFYCSSDSLSIFTSSDSSWSSLTKSFTGKITSCTFNKSTGVFVGTETGIIYFSNDNGATWSNVINIGAKLLTATSDERLFAVTDDGAVISFEGEDFSPIMENPSLNMIHSKLFTDRKFSRIFAQNSIGLYFSEDNGNTWVRSNYEDEQIRTLLATNDGQYFISTNNSIFKSIDNGRHWEEILHKAVQLFSDCWDNTYYSYGSKLYRSSDKGNEWETVITNGISVEALFSCDGNKMTLFGDYNSKSKIGKSIDNGKTWEVSEIDEYLRLTDAVMLSNGNFVIYRDEGGDDSRILRSSDGGYAWEDVFYSGNKFVNLTNIDDRIYSGYKRFGATYSDNGGSSWNNIDSDGLTNKFTDSFIIDKDGYFYLSVYDGFWEPFNGGVFRSSQPIVTEIKDVEEEVPENYSLSQNYPNPFNPSTKIKYSIPVGVALNATATNVLLKVYDVLGKEVATLVNKKQSVGSYEVKFNSKGLSSGIYFYTLRTGSFVETKKMVLLR